MGKEKLSPMFWEQYFKAYDILNEAIPYKELIQTLVETLEVKNGDLILDAGAGTCNISIVLQKKGAIVTALDNSSAGLSICNKKNPALRTILHNLEEPLPFPDNSFDKIVSNNTLYLIDKKYRENIIREFHRILKPEGIVALSNVHTGFRPMPIYREHIRLSKKRFGVVHTFFQILKFIIPTIKIFHYNSKIKKSHNHMKEKTSFFETNEQAKLLSNAGFENVTQNKFVYAGQGILNVGVKL